jgi:hypothetical protein
MRQYDVGIQPHIALFEKHCKCKVDIPIKIKYIPSTEPGVRILGMCYGFKQWKLLRFIEIDNTYWASASYYEREHTILHELGHCVLDLEHDKAMTGDSIFTRPLSIMHPYTFSQYENYRKEYLKELFGRKRYQKFSLSGFP